MAITSETTKIIPEKEVIATIHCTVGCLTPGESTQSLMSVVSVPSSPSYHKMSGFVIHLEVCTPYRPSDPTCGSLLILDQLPRRPGLIEVRV